MILDNNLIAAIEPLSVGLAVSYKCSHMTKSQNYIKKHALLNRALLYSTEHDFISRINKELS